MLDLPTPPLHDDTATTAPTRDIPDGVKVLGLPRSIGEIYGLLFISRHPLSLDDLVITSFVAGPGSSTLPMAAGANWQRISPVAANWPPARA